MRMISISISLVLLALVLTWAPVRPALGQSESTATPVPMEEEAQAGEAEESSLADQIAQQAALNPPPALSELPVGITEIPCDVGAPIGAEEAEGETYSCGIFTVPMFWEDPDAGNIDLRFSVVSATGDDPEPDPLLFLAGGPGQSSVATALDAYSMVRTERDIVRLDQRGTGLSQRLGLEECLVLALGDEEATDEVMLLVQAISQPEEEAEDETSLETSREDDEPPSLLSSQEVNETVDVLCAREFTATGIDLNAFTTTQSARDIVELVKRLGYESFNLHGISYGTRLAMTVMADLDTVEDAPTLRSVVLDSPYPPSVYMLSSLPENGHGQVIQLFADCRQDAACRTAYPNLEQRFGQLLAQLETEPLQIEGETVTVADVTAVVSRLTNTRAGYMPRMIAELEMGVLDTYLGLRSGELGSGAPEGDLGLDMSDPVQVFIARAVPYSSESADMGELIGFLFGVLEILSGDDPLVALQAFIDDGFEGENRTALTDLAAELTLEDVQNSPVVQDMQAAAEETAAAEPPSEEELAAQQFAQQRLFAIIDIAHFLNKNIHCNEDVQFERLEDGVNAINDLAFPQFADYGFLREQSMACDNWPVEAAPITVKNPVSSTVPTLILQGAYDTRTPPFMGRRTARELEKSTLVMVPQQGHEVWVRASNCAGQIASSFVMDPERELDLTCLDARRPQWALPSDAGAHAGNGENVIEATFICPDGTSIAVSFDHAADTATVDMPDGPVTLPRVESGSGARYSDGMTTFWNQGDEALAEVDGVSVYENCVTQE